VNRRTFITGIAGMLVAKQAAALVPSGILMPVRRVWPAESMADWGRIHTASASDEVLLFDPCTDTMHYRQVNGRYLPDQDAIEFYGHGFYDLKTHQWVRVAP
jgi:hypothetical protein